MLQNLQYSDESNQLADAYNLENLSDGALTTYIMSSKDSTTCMSYTVQELRTGHDFVKGI